MIVVYGVPSSSKNKCSLFRDLLCKFLKGAVNIKNAVGYTYNEAVNACANTSCYPTSVSYLEELSYFTGEQNNLELYIDIFNVFSNSTPEYWSNIKYHYLC